MCSIARCWQLSAFTAAQPAGLDLGNAGDKEWEITGSPGAVWCRGTKAGVPHAGRDLQVEPHACLIAHSSISKHQNSSACLQPSALQKSQSCLLQGGMQVLQELQRELPGERQHCCHTAFSVPVPAVPPSPPCPSPPLSPMCRSSSGLPRSGAALTASTVPPDSLSHNRTLLHIKPFANHKA